MLFDEAMMMWLVMVECDPETKVGVQVLREKISNTKSAMFDNDVSTDGMYSKHYDAHY